MNTNIRTTQGRMQRQITLNIPDHLAPIVEVHGNFDELVNHWVTRILEEEADFQAATMQGVLRDEKREGTVIQVGDRSDFEPIEPITPVEGSPMISDIIAEQRQ